MKKSINHQEYVKASIRLEELIYLVDDNTPKSDPLAIEFINVSNIIEAYEEIHFPIG
ncbi:MAG: XRE family transcriptional regulator [Flavobacteriaceae bacterium]|nr:XRE family transcriptional regulator [Flavobacteriaceae bacterium]